MKTLFITGATGFTGRYLIEAALEHNYKIVALVRPSSNTSLLKKYNIEFRILDLENTETLTQNLIDLKKQIGNLDLFIHNAGITKARKREDYIAGNTNITISLINAIIASELSPTKFIYTSSLAATGPGDSITLDPIDEEAPFKPVTFYGESKQLAEEYIREKSDFPWIIMRPTAVYGPGDSDTLHLFKSTKMGFEVQATKAEQHLTFIYVEDMAKAYYQVAEKSPFHKIYNLSDGHYYCASKINEYIKKTMGKKTIKLRISPWLLKIVASIVEFLNFASDKVSILNRNKVNELTEINWKADSSKIQNEIGFHATTKLKNGITKTYNWYIDNGWI